MARLTVVAACGLVLAAGALQSLEPPAVQAIAPPALADMEQEMLSRAHDVQRPEDVPPVAVEPEFAPRLAFSAGGAHRSAERGEQAMLKPRPADLVAARRAGQTARVEVREENLGGYLSVEDEMLLRDQQPRLGR
mmetsp:Transcript_104816/g.273617  ORF Transcript_104816/g.273617 Transcript_104816/m.273617 type:complete len:135 (+) Transcript_104816:90-494(+)